MRVSRLTCGCGWEQKRNVETDVPEFNGYIDITVLCPSCDENGGDYKKSPTWSHKDEGKLSKKTEAFLAKAAMESSLMEKEFGKPKDFGKKRAK